MLATQDAYPHIIKAVNCILATDNRPVATDAGEWTKEFTESLDRAEKALARLLRKYGEDVFRRYAVMENEEYNMELDSRHKDLCYANAILDDYWSTVADPL